MKEMFNQSKALREFIFLGIISALTTLGITFGAIMIRLRWPELYSFGEVVTYMLVSSLALFSVLIWKGYKLLNSDI